MANWGTGNTENVGDPVKIDQIRDCNRLTRTIHSIPKDGSLWGIGRNNRGQLGDGTTMDKICRLKSLKRM